MKIFYSSEFSRRYKRLPERIKDLAKEKEKIFREDPFDQRLKTYKLKGRYSNFWAFSVDFGYRIIFKFHGDNAVRFYAVGDHSIYKNF
ncbi:MAG: type II toxin-antitoxin system mRNA interferase toxin, RelE/StbE family [Patescibacteria group bacterium]